VQERRARFQAEDGLVEELIVSGTARTRREVRRTLAGMREAMGLTAAFTEFRRHATRRSAQTRSPVRQGAGAVRA
jgi:tryptophanyl-tRNA synthetase